MFQRQICRAVARSCASKQPVRFAAASFRGFSTGEAEEDEEEKRVLKQIVTPAGEYAHAFLDDAIEEGYDIKKVSENLEAWGYGFEVDANLRRYMVDADFEIQADEDKKAEVEAKLQDDIFEAFGFDKEKDEDLFTASAVGLLIQDDMVEKLPQVVEDFQILMMDYLQIVPCVVTSAIELTESQSEVITGKIHGMVTGAQTAEIAYNIDSELLGGLTVRIGDDFQDLSARSAIYTCAGALKSI